MHLDIVFISQRRHLASNGYKFQLQL